MYTNQEYDGFSLELAGSFPTNDQPNNNNYYYKLRMNNISLVVSTPVIASSLLYVRFYFVTSFARRFPPSSPLLPPKLRIKLAAHDLKVEDPAET